MAWALIGLGSNLGDRRENIQKAFQAIETIPNVRALRTSRLVVSSPAGGPVGQPRFYNAAMLVETSESPESLLQSLQTIEIALGRKRNERWSARTIDLDILMFENTEIESPTLTLPHPRMAFRRFVLEPVAEIAGDTVHSTSGWTIQQLLDHQKTGPVWIALAGPNASLDRRENLVNTLVTSGIVQTCDVSQVFAACENQQNPERETTSALKASIEKYANSIRTVLETATNNLEGCRKQKNYHLPLVVPICLEKSVYSWIDSLEHAKEFYLSLRQSAYAMLQSVPKPTLVVSFEKKQRRNRKYTINGPVLWLGDASEEEAESEITAALVAMQPVDVLE